MWLVGIFDLFLFTSLLDYSGSLGQIFMGTCSFSYGNYCFRHKENWEHCNKNVVTYICGWATEHALIWVLLENFDTCTTIYHSTVRLKSNLSLNKRTVALSGCWETWMISLSQNSWIGSCNNVALRCFLFWYFP